MGIGTLFFRSIKREYYREISPGLLILNWIVQRIFRLNHEVPFSVHYTSKVRGYQYMQIHTSVRKSMTISQGLYMICFHQGKLTIGANTMIAPYVVINNGNHDFIDRSKHKVKDISIGENCWIGAHCVILAGAELGNNVTVAAGSVVNKIFPDNVVIGGVPARVIKTIDKFAPNEN
jgi:acetyltransferase-like isoleucine patch superfamily enzyme